MRFRLLNGCFFGRRLKAFLVTLGIFGLGVSAERAQAETSITPLAPYLPGSSQSIYYLADRNSTTPLTVDEGAGFKAFDFTAGLQAGDPDRNDLIQIRVQTNTNFQNRIPIVQMTAVSTSAGEQLAPIATVAGRVCVDNSTCFRPLLDGGNELLGFPFARLSDPLRGVTVGFYLRDICNILGFTADGCENGAVKATGNQAFILKFTIFGVTTLDEIPTTTPAAGTTVELRFKVQRAKPVMTCPPNPDEIYFPGDRAITINSRGFRFATGIGVGAPAENSSSPTIGTLIVTARNGSDPDTSGDFSFNNSVTGRLPIQGGGGRVEGFENTTTGSDNLYRVRFMARDSAGVLSDASDCGVGGIQTADIQGLLKENGCFIATAAWGIEGQPTVRTLRQFRDQVLLQHPWGRSFVKWYYRWSPGAAQWVLDHPWTRPLLRALLTPVRWLAELMTAEAHATETQPYIDSIKRDLPTNEPEESYIEKIRRERKPELPTGQGKDETYIQFLKRTSETPPEKLDSLIEERKRSLGPPEQASAISDYKEGRLPQADKGDPIKRKMTGFKFGASTNRQVLAETGTGRTFQDIYGEGWQPDFTFFYEYRPWAPSSLGSVGLYSSLGLSFSRGKGRFAFELAKPSGEGTFGAESGTTFRFITVPVVAGVAFRLKSLLWIEPYLTGGALAVPYFESRDDNRDGNRGWSKGFAYSFGVNIPLDGIDKKNGWDLYASWGIKRHYVSIDYTTLYTIGSSVDFTITGLLVGLGFEL